jgi:hypothetical protein
VTKERKEGNLEFAGYQGCSGYVGCGIVVIYSVSELASASWVGRLRESGETQLYCTWVYDCNKSNCQSNTRLRSRNAWQYDLWTDGREDTFSERKPFLGMDSKETSSSRYLGNLRCCLRSEPQRARHNMYCLEDYNSSVVC